MQKIFNLTSKPLSLKVWFPLNANDELYNWLLMSVYWYDASNQLNGYATIEPLR